MIHKWCKRVFYKQMEVYGKSLEKGVHFAEQFWFSLARRIVQIAGAHYKWTDEEWTEMMNLFLRPNDYKVIST